MVSRRAWLPAQPAYLRREASEAGLRIIGIDRPGYGLSTPRPGRTIAGWVPVALAVADHVGIGQFATVGVSTGGAFALALAALAAERVLGVVACCSMTDMRWPEGRATMSRPHTHAVWEAPGREAALAAAADAHGQDGSKMRGGGMAAALAPSDVALFRDPGWVEAALAGFAAMFARGAWRAAPMIAWLTARAGSPSMSHPSSAGNGPARRKRPRGRCRSRPAHRRACPGRGTGHRR